MPPAYLLGKFLFPSGPCFVRQNVQATNIPADTEYEKTSTAIRVFYLPRECSRLFSPSARRHFHCKKDFRRELLTTWFHLSAK